ncbi:MAG: hypothetical protein ABIS06_07220 [Vicinamibacterales bacterium]
MKRSLRVGALLIALAGVIDPAVAFQRRAPLPIQLLLPETHDLTFVEADRIRSSLLAVLGDAVDADSSEPPRAMVALGNAVPRPYAVTVPVFSISVDSPRLSAVTLDAADAIDGQRQVRFVRFEGHRLQGRSSEFVLRRGEARLAVANHRWSQDDETFEARLEFVSPAAGLDALRLTAGTEGIAPVSVDLPVMVSSRKLRVLIYEPRPSWSASFVRMALESDPAFDVRTTTSTSRGISTVTAGPPASLGALDPNRFDVVAVGGLDLLTAADLDTLERFASVRGGTMVLFPDARIPDRVGSALELPSFDEVLVERPIDVQTAVATLRASELLLPRSGAAKYRSLATVTHSGAQRTAVVVTTRGSGQIIVSGLLDGWRYRGERDGAFAGFWRGTIADAASAAAPRLALQVDPLIARPGRQIRIRATVRLSECTHETGAIRFPTVRASLVAPEGEGSLVRLWPAAVPGVYEATIVAPSEGRYTVRVEGLGVATEVPIVIDPAATPVTPDHSRGWAQLAHSSGGATFKAAELERVASRLQQIDAPQIGQRMHPMRSGWWMFPFAFLLSTEWALRRRQGLR